MKFNILIDVSPPAHVWQNSDSGVLGQNVVGQSNCRIL